MSGPIETYFDEIDFDFLEEIAFSTNELDDCYLSNEELQQFFTPSAERWIDISPKSYGTVFALDSAKDFQWKLAMEEIVHVKSRLASLIGHPNPSAEDVIKYCIGPKSEVGMLLQKELQISSESYLRFMSTFCVQAAYRVSSTELFCEDSLLKKELLMSETDYNQTWARLAKAKQIPSTGIRTARDNAPIWEGLETTVNNLLRSISISGRDGKIAIALDDDKIWFGSKVAQRVDLFNLKFTTHVKANRKSIVAHTAVSTGVNIPLGIVFERTKDTSYSCFKRLLDFLFGGDGSTNLRSVYVHSDRGYMLPNIVFEYLLACGAEVLGTVKRMANCWPFTYNQNVKESDKRTVIDPKGGTTLYMKWCKVGRSKPLFASAFRNGSQSVATAISSLHKSHEWEGIVYKPSERVEYEKDPSSLVPQFFQRVDLEECDPIPSEGERLAMLSLLDLNVVPYTLRQGELNKKSIFYFITCCSWYLLFLLCFEGTADWHYLRKFSLTSSQAHRAFKRGFSMFQNDPAWINVAKYLYGEESWRKELGLPSAARPPEQQEIDTDDESVNNFVPVSQYIIDLEPKDNADHFAARSKLLEFVVVSHLDSDDSESAEEPDQREKDEGDICPSDSDAKEELQSWPAATRRAALDILLGRVPEEHQKRNGTNADLVKWLQQPNSRRDYFFYREPPPPLGGGAAKRYPHPVEEGAPE